MESSTGPACFNWFYTRNEEVYLHSDRTSPISNLLPLLLVHPAWRPSCKGPVSCTRLRAFTSIGEIGMEKAVAVASQPLTASGCSSHQPSERDLAARMGAHRFYPVHSKDSTTILHTLPL